MTDFNLKLIFSNIHWFLITSFIMMFCELCFPFQAFMIFLLLSALPLATAFRSLEYSLRNPFGLAGERLTNHFLNLLFLLVIFTICATPGFIYMMTLYHENPDTGRSSGIHG